MARPAPEDDKKESEPAQVEEDKERAELVTKEAMLRVTGGPTVRQAICLQGIVPSP